MAAITTQVQNRLIELYEAEEALADAWKVPISKRDSKGVSRNDSPRLCIVRFQTGVKDGDLGISWDRRVRIAVKTYLHDESSDPEAAVDQLSALVESVENVLLRNLAAIEGGVAPEQDPWYNIRFADPLTEFYSRGKAEYWAVTVAEFACMVDHPR
jgi:hypothetical protein